MTEATNLGCCCPKCGRAFKTWFGVRVHYGRKHNFSANNSHRHDKDWHKIGGK
jgi:hypothetical protein